MTNISECNCGNCTNQSTLKCPMQWDGFNGNSDKLYGFNAGNRSCGCLSHPRAREVLMREVVEDLERRAEEEDRLKRETKSNESWMGHAYANGAYLKTISLIRDGVNPK